jgi:hypothetical protein
MPNQTLCAKVAADNERLTIAAKIEPTSFRDKEIGQQRGPFCNTSSVLRIATTGPKPFAIVVRGLPFASGTHDKVSPIWLRR